VLWLRGAVLLTMQRAGEMLQETLWWESRGSRQIRMHCMAVPLPGAFAVVSSSSSSSAAVEPPVCALSDPPIFCHLP